MAGGAQILELCKKYFRAIDSAIFREYHQVVSTQVTGVLIIQ